ncbi:hypothetical protein [Pseudarthrobacter cellobiosi]|uniref:hypothetical protein n=1 Tax=Pseudarthrobacter cellobiosi TaxID=2953654 RepID=UPI00208E4C2D|nr:MULTISPECIES: hypothetical protein [unclassified Pseudarthrobacter]MCO4256917.1 hypothetical protein [Pseudarthrobacter sp. HLT1-5]MCO4276427.1 hypothetical protein [Pseudarthrobacter sp. HLT3-5]
MNVSRRLLFASACWEIARPRTALNAGHLLIRLTNPAIAFDLRSATDWLHCHNIARQALADVLGASRCTVVFAHQWHPIGAAIGEPEAESSTPTFHVFGRWDAEPVTPGEQLRLPVQRRVPAAADELKEYDGGLRSALRRLAVERPAEPVPPVDDTLPELTASAPKFKAGAHHTVLAPVLPPAPGDGLTPGHLLALAAAVDGLTARPGVTGLSCVVPEPGPGGQEVHAMGRSAGESLNPMQEFLDLPKVSQALL